MLLAVFSSYCYSQKIMDNKIDDFNGKQFITTSWEKLGPNVFNVVLFRFRYENGIKYFELVYKNGVNDIALKDMAIEFKTENKIYELKNSQTSMVRSSGDTDVLRYIGDMDFFTNSIIEKIRIHFQEGYDNYEIKDSKRRSLIGKSYQLLIANIKGAEEIHLKN